MQWIPSMGLIVTDNGRVAKWNPATNTWSLIASGLAFNYSNFMDYNPVLGIVLFGGGGQTPKKLFKMTVPSGVVTPLNDSPFALGTQSPSGAVVTHDPNTGLFLILPQSGILQQYDVSTETWTALGAVPFYTGNGAGNIQAVPIPEYGAVFVIMNKHTIWGNNLNGTFLYKHSAGPLSPPTPTVPGPPTGLKLQHTLKWAASADPVFGYKIYDNGLEIGTTTNTFFDIVLEPGSHVITVQAFNDVGFSDPSNAVSFFIE